MRTLPVLFLLILLPACGLFPAPQTPAQSLAAAESAATAAITAAAAAREQGLIQRGSDLEVAVDRTIRGLNAALDAAQGALRAGRSGDVADWITTATNATASLNAILREVRR